MDELDVEIVGEVRSLTAEETVVKVPALTLKSLRDSHQTAARLLARGLTPLQVSLQTGYSSAYLSNLQRDPTFIELMEHYRRDADAEGAAFEERMLLVSRDYLQAIHEDLLEHPEEITTATKAEVFKLLADRAGFAPVTRSVNKNINLNVGARLDEARRRLSTHQGSKED